MKKIKDLIFHNFVNALGWHTDRKLLVIESDDWGSLRMTSKEAIIRLEGLGVEVTNDRFNCFDALENSQDFSRLFEVLDRRRDMHGNPACITTNTIMANPDFSKIEDSGFQHYHYIGLKESYERYSDGESAMSALSNGVKQKFIYPQFHGREHLNVSMWMNALRNNSKTIMHGFKEHVFGLKIKDKVANKNNYMAAFDTVDDKDIQTNESAILDGLNMFEDFFEFKSKTFIAPSYIWGDSVEKTTADTGIKGIQGISFQYIPTGKSLKKKLHYTGQVNKYGQSYIVRNAFFEPSLEFRSDVIDNCLARIETAFKWKKPAIIGSHRINYIGSLVESNREDNLRLLDQLLVKVLKKWPEVEFISSAQLIDIMKSAKQ
ncbi:hypothetical protein ABID22_002053 [Pontibacter aydingkolensis]|uniref:Polysaccharide (De)acetylase n=1 Tax=Pontibacter aydingkolensis TaxID=1911536 RepID=A0ABS7CUY1_9BACT|nr:hypothetical protein [Pontibacter aydingkolensis]MBW7467669.1 hypothetical protein [Pontibacter aydingkolensis]